MVDKRLVDLDGDTMGGGVSGTREAAHSSSEFAGEKANSGVYSWWVRGENVALPVTAVEGLEKALFGSPLSI